MSKHHTISGNIARTLLLVPALLAAAPQTTSAQLFPGSPSAVDTAVTGVIINQALSQLLRDDRQALRHALTQEPIQGLTQEQQANCETKMTEMLHKGYSLEELAKIDAKERGGYKLGRDESVAQHLRISIENHRCIIHLDQNNNLVK